MPIDVAPVLACFYWLVNRTLSARRVVPQSGLSSLSTPGAVAVIDEWPLSSFRSSSVFERLEQTLGLRVTQKAGEDFPPLSG
jgi:hypothetical protein